MLLPLEAWALTSARCCTIASKVGLLAWRRWEIGYGQRQFKSSPELLKTDCEIIQLWSTANVKSDPVYVTLVLYHTMHQITWGETRVSILSKRLDSFRSRSKPKESDWLWVTVALWKRVVSATNRTVHPKRNNNCFLHRHSATTWKAGVMNL